MAEMQSAEDAVDFILSATEKKKLIMATMLWSWWNTDVCQ
jgi:hypothetical protein